MDAPAPDSGVETEGDQESNDSSLSSVSLGNPTPPVQAPPIVASTSSRANAGGASASLSNLSGATPEPAFVNPNKLQPPPSVTEDGYLGDCSSDGGNEKNFPMPAHLLKRLVKNSNKTCPCHPEQQPSSSSNASSATSSSAAVAAAVAPSDNAISADTFEPPAGLSFQNLSPSNSVEVAGLGFGYQINFSNGKSSSSSRKMKSSLKIKTNPRLIGKTNAWSHAVDALSERKLRTAASTNNTELMYNLITKGVNVNSADEQQRTALHFAASKGYSQVVNLLLQVRNAKIFD